MGSRGGHVATSGDPAGGTTGRGDKWPASMTRAVWTWRALVAMSALTALVTWYFSDELVRTWASRNPAARPIYEAGGLEALEASAIDVPQFVSVAVVLFVCWFLLAGVLVVFFRGGHGWARLSLSALALFALFAGGVSVARSLPAAFTVMAVVTVCLNLVLLFFLWHRDTSAYLRHGPSLVE